MAGETCLHGRPEHQLGCSASQASGWGAHTWHSAGMVPMDGERSQPPECSGSWQMGDRMDLGIYVFRARAAFWALPLTVRFNRVAIWVRFAR